MWESIQLVAMVSLVPDFLLVTSTSFQASLCFQYPWLFHCPRPGHLLEQQGKFWQLAFWRSVRTVYTFKLKRVGILYKIRKIRAGKKSNRGRGTLIHLPFSPSHCVTGGKRRKSMGHEQRRGRKWDILGGKNQNSQNQSESLVKATLAL